MTTDNILSYRRNRNFRLRYPRKWWIIVLLPLLGPFFFYLMPRAFLLRENAPLLTFWCLGTLLLFVSGVILLIRNRRAFRPNIVANAVVTVYLACAMLLILLAYRDVFACYTADDSFIVQCKATAFTLYSEAEGHNGAFPRNLESEVAARRIDAEQLYHPLRLPRSARSGASLSGSDIIYVAGSLALSKQVDWGKIVIFQSRDLFWNHTRVIGFADGSYEVVTPTRLNKVLQDDETERLKNR